MNAQRKIKASVVVFDQGNTLILDPFLKVMELQKESFQEILRRYGILPDLRGQKSKVKSHNALLTIDNFSLISAWSLANKQVDYPFIGHFVQEEPIVQRALRGMGIKEEVAAVLGLDLLREYREGLKQVIVSDPRTQEVKETLQKLSGKGKKLGIFSNDRIIGLGLVLEAMDIRALLQYVETSESIGVEKPDSRVFQHMISFFQTEPRDMVYVGDDPIRDIDAAKDAGIKTIRYLVDDKMYAEPWRDYAAEPRHAPDAAVESFSEILEILG